jgi:hypothetical protein
MIQREDLLHNLDKHTLWKKYCGFLDLSTEEFMAIQAQLLLEQIELVSSSPLAKKIIGDSKPSSVEEFRNNVPVTTYKDYTPYLDEKREDVLSEKPFSWVHTSGVEGNFKWVPYTSRGYYRLIDSLVSALILASANKKGEVNVKKGARIIFHLPSRPYLGGHFAFGLSQRITCQSIPSLEIFDRISFEERVDKELEMVKKNGADFILSLPGNLVDMGAKFTEQLNKDKPKIFSISSLRRILRLIKTRLISRIREKPILPRHLYQPYGLISIGADSHFYQKDIEYFWGKKPYDIYLATETGCLAFPSWDGDGMIFTPFSGFLEFIPEEEWINKNGQKPSNPKTLLLNELEVGKRYEIVVTNFYGMPFLRYRLGDIVKITSMKNRVDGTSLPKLQYESRIRDIINVGTSLEISEKQIWQSLLNSGLKYEDWFLVTEKSAKKDTLHLYVELKNGLESEIEKLFFESNVPIELDIKSIPHSPDVPLKVTVLPVGTFQHYKKDKEAAGFDPACFKAMHMNPQDNLLKQLTSSNGTD